MPELTPVELPKTINEAINILAYNDYFYRQDPNDPKTHVNPHPKDKDTVRSLAESQYPWTEKQGKLAVIILKRYLTKFHKYGISIKELLDKPIYDRPFRKIDWEKSIEKYTNEDNEDLIELKFPYSKKIVTLIRCLKDKRGMPMGFMKYDGDKKHWTCKQTDVISYYLTLIAIRYDFKFVDTSLLDDYYEVKKEIENYKDLQAKLVGNEIVLCNAPNSMQEYWDKNLKNKSVLQQVDALKNLHLSTDGINVPAENKIAKKIAHQNNHKLWIDKSEYNKNDLIAGLTELDCFPIIMTVSGEVNTVEDIQDYWSWLKCFENHGIDILKQLSFGFEIKEPLRDTDVASDFGNFFPNSKLDDANFEKLFELHQMSRQFKFIDKQTKVIFVRNRVPRALLKSGIKPKASLVSLGGGYFTSGTENLKRFLENLPKKLYYSDKKPGDWDWQEKTVIKL